MSNSTEDVFIGHVEGDFPKWKCPNCGFTISQRSIFLLANDAKCASCGVTTFGDFVNVPSFEIPDGTEIR